MSAVIKRQNGQNLSKIWWRHKIRHYGFFWIFIFTIVFYQHIENFLKVSFQHYNPFKSYSRAAKSQFLGGLFILWIKYETLHRASLGQVVSNEKWCPKIWRHYDVIMTSRRWQVAKKSKSPNPKNFGIIRKRILFWKIFNKKLYLENLPFSKY